MSMTLATLLLTDVVDSTKLVETLGDARAARVWAAHDAVARDLLPLHGGREIDKTDGFLLLFDRPQDAVAYALAYHEAIAALDPPLQARAGLHRGEVVLRENPAAHVARGAKPLEVEGLAKPLAARVMSLAVGGQTLLTGPVRNALGEQAEVRSHGHYRMKGVAEPVELFELDTGAALTPPPDSAKVWRVQRQGDAWVAATPPPHSLPAERDAFVGRDADLSTLSRLVDDGARLVSVLGIGGTGKTRLVTRFAWTWLGAWPGGAWFADLSEARSAEGICHALGQALDVPLTKGEVVAQLGHAIAGRGRCLVVLDNFEQVARHADETLGRWLDRAHEACFVVTSREVLGLSGEQALPLAPLALPEAVALFQARAAQARPGFTVGPAERPTVEALVRLLDHLPLAIELAAARVRLMPPDKLLARMDQRFKLLASSGGRRDRQATLRAAIDWSWDLLSPDEQAALAQVSVFEGGFTLEAAEAVLELDELWPTDAVQSLLDKSLIRQVGEERFDLLVSVQEYAAEKLDALGLRDGAELRHGAFFALSGTTQALDRLERRGGPTLLAALALELDNLTAACRRAVLRQDLDIAFPAVLACNRVLNTTGPLGPRSELLGQVLAIASEAHPAWLPLLVELGGALGAEERLVEAELVQAQALAAARARGDDRALAWSLLHQGGLCYRRGDGHGTYRNQSQALERFVALGDEAGQVLALSGCVSAGFLTGDLDPAVEAGRRALELSERCGFERRMPQVCMNLGNVLMQKGELQAALDLQLRAVEGARRCGERVVGCLALSNAAGSAWLVGQRDLALELLDAGLALAREVGERRAEHNALANKAFMSEVTGRSDEAMAAYRQAMLIAEETEDQAGIGRLRCSLGGVLADVGRVDEGRAMFLSGSAMLREQGNRPGLVEALAEWVPREARVDPVRARAILEEAEALVIEQNMSESSQAAQAVRQARAALAAAEGKMHADR